MSKTELKPCPFCGASVRLHQPMPGYYQISCFTAGCCGKTGMFLDGERAITQWNRRASAMERLKRIEVAANMLQETGSPWIDDDDEYQRCKFCGVLIQCEHDDDCKWAALEATLKEIDDDDK